MYVCVTCALTRKHMPPNNCKTLDASSSPVAPETHNNANHIFFLLFMDLSGVSAPSASRTHNLADVKATSMILGST